MRIKDPNSRMRMWVVLAIAGVMGIAIVGFLFGKISKIKCQSPYGDCPEYYLARLDYLHGRSIFFPPSQEEVSKVLSSYVEISHISLSRQFPTTLLVSVTYHEAYGTINNFFVDENGHVLGIASASALPKLNSDRKTLPGKVVEAPELAALQSVKKTGEFIPNSFDSSLVGNILSMQISPQTVVILDVISLPESWADSLQLILTRSKIDGKVPQKVDMRFNNPIIVY